jgi:hypothetical protein
MSEKWDTWYSGKGEHRAFIGSSGKYKAWKWETIKRYVDPIDDVIDLCCGDLAFWTRQPIPEKYLGIDISPVVIERNQKKYPKLTFIEQNATTHIPDISAPVVMCLDVLFHIIDDEDHRKIIENAASYSTNWVIFFTLMKYRLKLGRGLPMVYRDPGHQFKYMTKKNFMLAGAHQLPFKNGIMYIWKKL